MDNKKINTREILRIERLNSERNDLKKLKLKHFVPKDRVLLGKKLKSDKKIIQKLIDSDLGTTLKDIKGFKDAKIKPEKILEILKDDLKELDSKLRILKKQTKIVSNEKKRLSKKKDLFQKRILKLYKVLKIELGRERVLKKEKRKI